MTINIFIFIKFIKFRYVPFFVKTIRIKTSKTTYLNHHFIL